MEKQGALLVVDDDPDLRDLLSEYLGKAGYRVRTAANAREMFISLRGESADLVILDVMMPGQDGVSACRELRTRSAVPVLMLTALGDPIERTVGLEVGADDYLGKPFLPRELLARVRAILRRSGAQGGLAGAPSRGLVHGFVGWRVDYDRRQLTSPQGGYVDLTTAEFKLLGVFLERPQRVLSREFLLEATHGELPESFDRSIDVLVSRLRNKLEDNAKEQRLIRTVRGDGYLFVEPVQVL
ncbi:MAG: response regulator transcription factor [Betaproteobacteria bacterium]|nr:response regulator transcription factor [Betaproteobacteria bacterium]